MYVCGPTVYKPSHIGHMVGPVIFDTVKRYLTYLGYEVTWVVNITDVDDKLIVRSPRSTNTTVKELAERMTRRLPRLPAEARTSTGIDHMPRATEHIAEIIAIIQGLIDKGFAYPAGGDVYFDVSKDADYGKLCHRDPGAARSRRAHRGQRQEAQPRRLRPVEGRQAGRAVVGQPLGAGPARLAHRVLGHEHEATWARRSTSTAAASTCSSRTTRTSWPSRSRTPASRSPRYWMHNGLMKMGTAKMAGSVGNVVNVVDLLKQHQPGDGALPAAEHALPQPDRVQRGASCRS